MKKKRCSLWITCVACISADQHKSGRVHLNFIVLIPLALCNTINTTNIQQWMMHGSMLPKGEKEKLTITEFLIRIESFT